MASSECEDIKRAIVCHTMVLQSISKTFLLKILSLNHPLAALNNATLRTTLMVVTMSNGKKLFLSVNPTWNGQGFNVSYPTIYASQAHDFVEYLPAYLMHSHGNEVFCWFTPDTVTKAQAIKNQPISSDGLDFWNTLQSLQLEWCIASPLSTAPTNSPAVDLDNITLPSFNTTTKHPLAQLGVPSTAPTTVQLLTASTSITTPDDLMVASTVDTRLSALE